ncbi:MAG TPA: AmmeMemoRadiSam system protein B, partial [Vicinamibacterales bacterium]|nr:AmmeMemoRadiSam system protein B [Vicinamibacterales bacterium]
GALEREIDELLAAAAPPPAAEPVALIAPHAGLMFSGGVAAHAYRAAAAARPDVIVLVGPSHYVGFEGVAVVERGAFETPLGLVSIDEPLATALLAASPLVRAYPQAHAREHSLEMQLPFLQRVLPGVPFVPLAIGWQERETIVGLGDLLARAAADRRPLLVASTDLSHYFDAETAERLDRRVADYVARFDPDGLLEYFESFPEAERGRYVACGGGAAIAVMRAARALGARDAHVLRYAHSGDVSGDRAAVVGYLAAAFSRGGHAH